MTRFVSPSIEALWRFAGWRPGRKRFIHHWLQCIRNSGFTICDHAAAFLSEFGGLTGPLVEWNLRHEWIVDPRRCLRPGRREILVAAEAGLQCRLTPIAEVRDSVLAVAPDGRLVAVVESGDEIEWEAHCLEYRGSIADGVGTFALGRFVDWRFTEAGGLDLDVVPPLQTTDERLLWSPRYRLPVAGEILYAAYIAAAAAMLASVFLMSSYNRLSCVAAVGLAMLALWPIQWRLHASTLHVGGSLAGLELLRRPGWGRILRSSICIRGCEAEEGDDGGRKGRIAMEAIPLEWNVRSLFLDGEDLDDDSINRLNAAANLEELGIVRTQATDRSVDAILAMPRLRWIDIRGTMISPEGVRRLKTKPGLVVESDSTTR